MTHGDREQGMPWVSGSHQELGERPGREAPSPRVAGAQATRADLAGSAWLKLPAQGTVRAAGS